MGRSEENTGFVCAHCGQVVGPLTNGSYRNHCPSCLWSRHVDCKPGDRAADCDGLMEPIELRRTGKGWQVVHQCCRCAVVRANRVAERTAQPDDIKALIRLLNGRRTRPKMTPECRKRLPTPFSR